MKHHRGVAEKGEEGFAVLMSLMSMKDASYAENYFIYHSNDISKEYGYKND